MRKQNIQMLVLVSILVLCILGYLLVKAMPEEETQVNSQSHMVTNVIQEDVVEISYLYEGDIIELAKENDMWVVKENMTWNLEQSMIDTMLGYICSITTDTVIEDPQSLEEYGLLNPSNTICLTLSDGGVVQLLIGDYINMTGEYYALLAGDVNVYTVSSYIPMAFEKSVEELLVIEEAAEETTEETPVEVSREE